MGGQGGNLLPQLDLQGVLVNRVLKSVLDFFLTFCDTQQSCEISELNSSIPLGTHEQWHKIDSTHYNITVMEQMDRWIASGSVLCPSFRMGPDWETTVNFLKRDE